MVFVIRISLFFCSLCIFILHTQSVVYKSIKLDFFLWGGGVCYICLSAGLMMLIRISYNRSDKKKQRVKTLTLKRIGDDFVIRIKDYNACKIITLVKL